MYVLRGYTFKFTQPTLNCPVAILLGGGEKKARAKSTLAQYRAAVQTSTNVKESG